MKPNLNLIETKEQWDLTLEKVEVYDFYHTYDYHLLSKNPDEKAVLLEYNENNFTICIPLIIRSIEGTEFFDATSVYGYAGPISKNLPDQFDSATFKEILLDFLKSEKIVSVFSRLNPFIDNQDSILHNIGEIHELGRVVNIDLTKNIDEQRMIFSKTTKRYLNKCRRSFDVIKSSSIEDMETFRSLYYENMDRVNAKKDYYFSKEYFEKFVDSKDYETDVLMAIDKESKTIISAAMMVKTNNIIQYHISGTKNDYLSLSPIRLLIDEMRISGTGEGYKFFNLGGGLGNNEDELFRFKSSFSKDFKTFKIWKCIVDQDMYDSLVSKSNNKNESIDFFPLYRYVKND
ncbi:GNAT family N-acetyltransferase [Seonamhaeicola sp. ML3]|uniref:GNAT family N-acetyltransferase n=1 Tax=Seonamhaeicola sp. ML3 TaxID=2937786 RepID=UPI00200D6497|nr:GNAT family N-acetyltransferase [Seonamhaeicola sp. ML3]